MKHSDFHIGLEFYTASGGWRCTDVGTRVIVAISLEPHEIVTQYSDGSMLRSMTSDPCWQNGPPYAIDEIVMDEYDLPGCTLEPQ
jgi:hypothetical protein